MVVFLLRYPLSVTILSVPALPRPDGVVLCVSPLFPFFRILERLSNDGATVHKARDPQTPKWEFRV